MRVWVFSNEYIPRIVGGLGIVATQLSRNLAISDVETVVITRGASQQVVIAKGAKLQVIRFPKGSEFSAANGNRRKTCRIVRWLTKKGYPKPDVMHVHSVNFSPLIRYFQRKWGVPIVYTCHSLVKLEKRSKRRKLLQRRQEEIMKRADRIVVPSDWMRKKLEQLYPQHQAKISVIVNGVKVNQPQVHKKNHRLHRLLYVGRIVPIKGIEELIQAMAIVIGKKRVKLDVIGTGPRNYVLYLKQKAQQLGLHSYVRWLGYRKPWVVEHLYSQYSAVVVPSVQESFGLVALEALANGVPLVATRSGGLRQFVDEEVAEVISEVKPSRIAASIHNTLKHKRKTAERVNRGLNRASQYEWSNMAAHYKQLFVEIMENKRGEPIGNESLEADQGLEGKTTGTSVESNE